jgi:Tol biopolymer transport system component
MKKVMIVVGVALLISGCAGQNTKTRDSSSTEPGMTSTVSFTTIVEYGKSLDWCPANNLIAFGKRGDDSYYDVYVMNPDGSHERCLTGEECPQKHNGNPVWHPSGDYVVFTSENENVMSSEYDRVAISGRGINCNLWAVTADGGTFWQLTEYPTSLTNPRGVIHPQFSHDGKTLLWAERVGNKEGTPWGEWALKVADFVTEDRTCRLENIRVYQPGEAQRFYESHAFSRDDRKILFSGNLVLNQLESGLDIHELNLKTETLNRLTDTFTDWDEHAHYSPDGKKIAWMSSTDLGDLGITFDDIRNHVWGLKLKTELWIMDADGSHKQRLTYFNEPGNGEYSGHVIVSDSSWSPDGGKIAACIAYEDGKDSRNFHSRIILVELGIQKKNFVSIPHAEEPMNSLLALPVTTLSTSSGFRIIVFGKRWIIQN